MAYIPYVSGTLGYTGVHRHKAEPFLFEIKGLCPVGGGGGGGHPFFERVPLVEFMYFAFTIMPGKSYCRRLRSLLLYLC